MSRAIERLVEDLAEHIHGEFQAEFGFSMTIGELVSVQDALKKVLGDALANAEADEKVSTSATNLPTPKEG